MAALAITGLTRRFGAVQALAGIDLRAGDGELVAVLGPTGAGKTTTLRAIAGLDRPDAGAIHLGGEDITHHDPARRDVAMVFQNFSLYPHLTVGENLAFPLRAPWRRIADDQIAARVERAARILHIEPMLTRKPTMLSGGQMQRVAIGRAIVREPRLFLMDEPLTNLDAKLREELRVELKSIQRELKATTIYVTHDPIEAMALADRLVVLDHGRVLQDDTPDRVYASPAHRRVGELLGAPPMNFLAARVEGGQVRLLADAAAAWPCAAPAGEVVVGLRPEDLRVASDGAISARCEIVEFFGADVVVGLRIGDERVRIVVDERADLRPGTPCRLTAKAAAVHVFAMDGRRIASAS
ncbi:MAG TPA: ABC transporter ATP-binding protein [Planctomycetota bacterium]|nr:ABC transporter ATP-binding protein [Planctomycetota bacterium]